MKLGGLIRVALRLKRARCAEFETNYSTDDIYYLKPDIARSQEVSGLCRYVYLVD